MTSMEVDEPTTPQGEFEHAVSIMEISLDEAAEIFSKLISQPAGEEGAEESQKLKEGSIYKLASVLAKQQKADSIIELLESLKDFFTNIPKARTAKIVRTLIDQVGTVKGATGKEIALCLQWIQWTRDEKRSFLRQRLESKLASLYLQSANYSQSLDIITRLLTEVKRLDDKAMLVEIHLLESRCHHALKNQPKAKAALTAARTSANAIYVPPLLQAEIDVLAGTLHGEEKDYKTAYSYFFEGFENYCSLNLDAEAVLCLKYMLMCKIMTENPEDVTNLISGKAGLKYSGREVEAMKAIAAAHTARSLQDFEDALEKFSAELKDDRIVHSHLAGLYETLLEQNLVRLIEPYSRVQISRIAELIKLGPDVVENKLSQMILDQKLNGILDQGTSCLILHPDTAENEMYSGTLGTMKDMGEVVDALFKKTVDLS